MRVWTAYLAAACAALLALLAVPATAREAAPLASRCHATAAFTEPLAAAIADPARWRCGAGEPSLAAERALLRFDALSDGSRFFAARPTLFDGLTLAIVRGGAVAAQWHYPADALVAGPNRNLFLVALPAPVRAGDQVVAAFDRPATRGVFADARLHSRDPALGRQAMIGTVLAAIVAGMLLMPLAFNAAYYRVLGEGFVLWQVAVTAGLLIQCLLTSGIAGYFVALPVPVHARLLILSGGLTAAAAACFTAAFIEEGHLSPALRRTLHLAALYLTVLSVAHAALPQLVSKQLFYTGFVPIMALTVPVGIDAWRRGSRAIRYLVAGWVPIMALGLIRIWTMVAPGVPPVEAMGLFYVAMVMESITTSLGVFSRFVTIKHQRDKALARAYSFERLSERDDLTGLFNRRALDGELGDFAQQGFTGFALFDLDNFKRVNDTHGHATGDAVLRTVAGVLDGHEEAVALRLGGEEFLLLLRGARVAERVERLREAIPVRIAREVAPLESLVTASAGLVEAAPGGTIGDDFTALYRTADDLLYEAKHSGRNLLAARTLQDAVPVAPAAFAAA